MLLDEKLKILPSYENVDNVVDFMITVPEVKYFLSNKYPWWFDNNIITLIKLKEVHRKRMKYSDYDRIMFKRSTLSGRA